MDLGLAPDLGLCMDLGLPPDLGLCTDLGLPLDLGLGLLRGLGLPQALRPYHHSSGLGCQESGLLSEACPYLALGLSSA